MLTVECQGDKLSGVLYFVLGLGFRPSSFFLSVMKETLESLMSVLGTVFIKKNHEIENFQLNQP